jgi:hypothetical protein
MPIPDNTLPMMTGTGPYGPIEMGGMFSTVKIREGIAHSDYADPGAYRQPSGRTAHEWTGELPDPVRAPGSESDGSSAVPLARKPATSGER